MSGTGDVSGADDLNPNLWGLAPTEQECDQAAALNRRRRYDAYEYVASMCVARPQVVVLFGVSETTLEHDIDAGDIVALDAAGTLFPAWQFDSNGALHVGVSRLMEVFGDAVALTEWMTTANCEFGGRTPAEALATEPDAVIRVADTLTAAAR